MNLVVDYGNTTAKVGIFDQHVLKHKRAFDDVEALKDYLRTASASNLLVSSVNVPGEDVIGWAECIDNKYVLHHKMPLPVTIRYATPETLGVDRIAGVCGGLHLFPGEDVLIIDAGTCVTYDFLDKQKNFNGGGIGPGMRMRFRAVHAFTTRLPLVEPVEHPLFVGHSTEASIQSGVIFGMVAELEGTIARYREQYPEVKVVLTGGDSSFFENKLKASIFASPNLVLIGLNSILIHNVELP